MISAIKQCAAEDEQDPTNVPSRFGGSLHSCQELESGQAMRQKNDMLHALNIASKKKQSRITFQIGMLHLDFKHEFIATELDTWGPKIDTLDNPRQDNKPPETPNLETSELIETFTESIKEMTNPAKVDSPNKQSNSGPTTTVRLCCRFD